MRTTGSVCFLRVKTQIFTQHSISASCQHRLTQTGTDLPHIRFITGSTVVKCVKLIGLFSTLENTVVLEGRL